MKKLAIILLAGLAPLSLLAQDKPAAAPDKPKEAEKPKEADKKDAPDFSALRFRAIGPALMSGRVGDIAVHPANKATWYVAVSSGGVWKTTNAGTTWTPIFQNEGSYSIGCITLDPKRPDTVWVGAGEANNQRSVGYGDGVYRSDDGGKSWRNLGLKTSEHIGRIAIDPRDSNVVYVAAYGPLWSAGGDRGLYKTTDGGKTWKKILEISENTGIADLALDPNNPDVILASAHQRRRHVWSLIHGGPESALYKSTDAGATFNKVKTGLPSGDLGRIGFRFSHAQKGLVYAIVETEDADKGGVFRSFDSGESWEKRDSYVGGPMYYAQIHPDPNVADRVYFMDVFARVSDDGGKTWRQVGERAKHVDNHVFWIDPDNSEHIICGNDGGVYESWDRGQIWRYMANLSVTQFYNVEVDNASPIYNVYGGTQDNNTVGGPSRTFGVQGSTNNDWFIVTGGDGFVARIDPTNPDIVYAESQYGGIVRLNRKTSERVPIQPVEAKGEPPLRFNWESPYLISPHNPARLYFAANRVFRSDDRGNSWTPVSPDLTRQINRDTLPMMGKVWPPEAIAKHRSTSTYGNITALAESRKAEGLLYAGTDDGNVQISEDGGKAWRKVEQSAFPGLPQYSPYGVYVQRLVASKHDANTVYALFDNHKNGDYNPYIYKSADRGRTWTALAANLPANAPALGFAEDHVNSNLLFCGTEFALHFTADGGKQWHRLKGNLPTIAVRDIAIQERENDLVLATFGRGFYVLDDYSALRAWSDELAAKPAHLFPVRKAVQFVPDTGKARGFQGSQLWMAENPPYGATITYFLKDALKSQRDLRKDASKEAEKNKKSFDYPSPAQLTAEEDEEKPAILLTVSDSAGRVVKHLTGPAGKGMHRVTWNLRGPSVESGRAQRQFFDEEESANLYRGGHYVAPGTYKVSLAKRVNGVTTPLNLEQSFTVEAEPNLQSAISDADRKLLAEHSRKTLAAQRSLAGTLESADRAKAQISAIRTALVDAPVDPKMLDTAASLDRRIVAIVRKLRGDETLRGLESGSPTSVAERIQSAYPRRAMSAPTGTMRYNLDAGNEELAAEQAKLKSLQSDLEKFKTQLDAAGVPWTTGRTPGLQ